MLFRSGGIVAAACALLTLGITSCTGKPTPLNTSSAVTSPSASASPTPSPSQTSLYPSDVPLTGKNLTKVGEKPPVYPEAARANTQAGALAFAKFFLQTIDWGYATTNAAYMRHYYGPTCGFCDGVAQSIDLTAKDNHWYLGGRFVFRSVAPTHIAPVTAPADYCSNVEIFVPAESVVDKTGKVFTGAAPANNKVKICLKFDTSWRVTYLAAA